MKTFAVVLACAIGALAIGQAVRQTSAAGGGRQLSIAQLIDIRHPSSPMCSPDGRSVVFVWDRAGVSRIYVASATVSPTAADRTADPRELAQAGSTLAGAFWSVDGQT